MAAIGWSRSVGCCCCCASTLDSTDAHITARAMRSRWRARSIAGTAKQQTWLPFSAASEASPAPQAAAGTPHPLPSLPARFAPALPPRPAPSTSLCRPGEYHPLFSTLFAPSSNLSSSASRAYLNQSDNNQLRVQKSVTSSVTAWVHRFFWRTEYRQKLGIRPMR